MRYEIANPSHCDAAGRVGELMRAVPITLSHFVLILSAASFGVRAEVRQKVFFQVHARTWFDSSARASTRLGGFSH